MSDRYRSRSVPSFQVNRPVKLPDRLEPVDVSLANAMRTDDEMDLIPTPNPDFVLPKDMTQKERIRSGEEANPLNEIERLKRVALGPTAPIAQGIQDAGEIIGLTPPLGPIPAAVQTGGDVLYTLAAGYQAAKGVTGKAAEATGGALSILNPIPAAATGRAVSKGAARLMDHPLVKRAMNYAYSQGVQEAGEEFGDYQIESSDDYRKYRDLEADYTLTPEEIAADPWLSESIPPRS